MSLTEKDRRWMSIAKKMMHNSRHSDYRFAALLVSGGRLIRVGFNSHGPAAQFARFPNNRSKHAEISAIFRLSKKDTKDAIIYIAGVSVANNTILTRPCKDCKRNLIKAGIRRVVFHDREGQIIEEKYDGFD